MELILILSIKWNTLTLVLKGLQNNLIFKITFPYHLLVQGPMISSFPLQLHMTLCLEIGPSVDDQAVSLQTMVPL